MNRTPYKDINLDHAVRAFQQQERFMLLYPDMTRQQYDGSETFVFAAPCTKPEWYAMKALHLTHDDGSHLPYLICEEEDDPVCIVLRFPETIDDHAIETAAWVRIKHSYRGMIYAMKYDPQPPSSSIASVIARTAGANPKQVGHFDLQLHERKQHELETNQEAN